jgi:hypothetical protein
MAVSNNGRFACFIPGKEDCFVGAISRTTLVKDFLDSECSPLNFMRSIQNSLSTGNKKLSSFQIVVGDPGSVGYFAYPSRYGPVLLPRGSYYFR